MPLNTLYHLSPFKLHNKPTKNLPFMNSITKIENGICFSQPSFGLEHLSNGMNLETKSLSLVGNMSYYIGSPSKHLLQRSISSHSLYKGDYEDGAVRRVHSANDITGRVDSSVSMSKEYSMIVEGMLKVSRYSPEEKKERIERYRRKRNLRNFKKKIQYGCRKILADTRRRSKGRFMRNEETPTMAEMVEERVGYDDHVLNDQHHIMVGEDEDYEGEENIWVNLLDYSFPCQY